MHRLSHPTHMNIHMTMKMVEERMIRQGYLSSESIFGILAVQSAADQMLDRSITLK